MFDVQFFYFTIVLDSNHGMNAFLDNFIMQTFIRDQVMATSTY